MTLEAYLSQFNALTRSRHLKTLSVQITVNGKDLKPRHEHATRLVAQGYRLNDKGRLAHPDGRFFLPKDLTQTVFDYVKFSTGANHQ